MELISIWNLPTIAGAHSWLDPCCTLFSLIYTVFMSGFIDLYWIELGDEMILRLSWLLILSLFSSVACGPLVPFLLFPKPEDVTKQEADKMEQEYQQAKVDATKLEKFKKGFRQCLKSESELTVSDEANQNRFSVIRDGAKYKYETLDCDGRQRPSVFKVPERFPSLLISAPDSLMGEVYYAEISSHRTCQEVKVMASPALDDKDKNVPGSKKTLTKDGQLYFSISDLAFAGWLGALDVAKGVNTVQIRYFGGECLELGQNPDDSDSSSNVCLKAQLLAIRDIIIDYHVENENSEKVVSVNLCPDAEQPAK